MSAVRQPPDGGWGWVCVVGGMMINLINGGLIMVFSLIYEEIQQRFHSTAMATAWVFAFNMMCRTLGGPLSTALARRFSCRVVCLVGGLMYSTGLFLTAFPPNLQFVYFSYGVIVGLGACLCVFPHLIIIGEYFDRNRSKALAIASMMDGLGAFLLAPLLKMLFETYGYTGTMIILSGLALNLCVAGALFRPLSVKYVRKQTSSTIRYIETESHSSSIEGSQCLTYTSEGVKEICKTSTGMSKGFINGHVSGCKDGSRNSCANGYVNSNTKTCTSGYTGTGNCENQNTQIGENQVEECEKHELSEKAQQQPSSPSQECMKSFFKYCDLPLLKNPAFLGVSLIMWGFGNLLATYNTFLAGFSKERGVTAKQVSILLAAMGGTIVGSKLISGVIFDLEGVRSRRVHLFAIIGMLSGGLTILCPLSSGVAGVYGVWLAIAFLNAWLFSQESTALFDVVGKERFPAALGLCRFLRGLGSIGGLVTGGVLRDATRRYSATFFFAGTLLFCFSLMFEVQQCLREKQAQKTSLKQKQSETIVSHT